MGESADSRVQLLGLLPCLLTSWPDYGKGSMWLVRLLEDKQPYTECLGLGGTGDRVKSFIFCLLLLECQLHEDKGFILYPQPLE